MKKINIKTQLATIIVILLFTGCTSDGTFSLDFNLPTGSIPAPKLDSVIASGWGSIDTVYWGKAKDEFGHSMIQAHFVYLNYSNAVKVPSFVKRTDTIDIPHSIPYTLGNYRIKYVQTATEGGLQVVNMVDDSYPDPTEISKLLEFRSVIIPIEKWAPNSGFNYNDYDAVCAYYNIEP